MTHTINFNQAVQDAKSVSFEALPVGDYDVQVVESTATQSSTGKPMIKVKMKVITGPYAPRVVLNQFVFSSDNPTALSIFFRHMRAFGLDEGFFASLGAQNSLDPVAAALVNRCATVKLSHRDWQGETRNNVDGFRPYAGAPTGGAPTTPGLPTGMPPAMPPAPAPVPGMPPAPAPVAAAPQPAAYPPAQPQAYAPAPAPAPAPQTPPAPAPAPAYVDPALAEMTNAAPPQQPAYQPQAYAPPAAPAPSQAGYAEAQQAYAPPPAAQPAPAPQQAPQPPAAVPPPPVPAPQMPI